ncbi:penicillin-binding transpeptidase domain-containing protein [Actinotalea sp. M2MS4P-6]|uniref:penicillin-binding transpeptidase domain-containing protein n=1 Tax=Actinotalea sp. M2MS4P-6 TaxID=2983762 RepID=UPI0021E421CF|nr:penicillin-binding transpeptidase domain-containing protein [Actinotalea sp. M2MS4P-6]MCV2393005.1 penicillin-binding transpeptidase domain-containing protein [Actinotalea sp. M2MS4P-6]
MAVLTVLVGLTGCTNERPGPEAAARALASALASGDFSRVVFDEPDAADTATARRDAAYAGLAPHEPQVTVGDITVDPEDEDAAAVALTFSWDLGAGEPWEYAVRAQLARGAEGDPDTWRATWASALLAPELTDAESLVSERVGAERGEVLGAGGVTLIVNRPVYRIGIDKTLGDEAAQQEGARALATALGMDPDAFAARVAEAGPKAFVEAIVVRVDDADYDVTALTASPTVRALDDSVPLAPTRAFARQVLGVVGPATAEIVDDSDGAVVAGDLAGLSGLVRQYDARLRSTPGLVVSATAEGSDASRELFSTDPVAGAALHTTLDVGLQTEADALLADVGPASAIVAVQPSTGDVLAVASGPGGDGMSTATLGQYAPGSTFKVVSSLALLRSGATADTDVPCTPTITVDGREFANFPDYPSSALGTVPLRTAFANSCNTAFISQRDAAPAQALVDAAGSLGWDGDGDRGFAAFLGSVPSDSTGTDHAATMIGQGWVLASPLGMATVAASVAAGHTVVPRVVTDDDLGIDATSAAAPLTETEAATLHELMRGVVTDGGATFLLDVPGAEVAAKTGTAEFETDGEVRNHAWMIAVQGDLAVAVFVDEGEYGSTTAGPLLEAFLRAANGG